MKLQSSGVATTRIGEKIYVDHLVNVIFCPTLNFNHVTLTLPSVPLPHRWQAGVCERCRHVQDCPHNRQISLGNDVDSRNRQLASDRSLAALGGGMGLAAAQALSTADQSAFEYIERPRTLGRPDRCLETSIEVEMVDLIDTLYRELQERRSGAADVLQQLHRNGLRIAADVAEPGSLVVEVDALARMITAALAQMPSFHVHETSTALQRAPAASQTSVALVELARSTPLLRPIWTKEQMQLRIAHDALTEQRVDEVRSRTDMPDAEKERTILALREEHLRQFSAHPDARVDLFTENLI